MIGWPKRALLKPDHHSPADAAGRFRTTRWSVVLLSAQSKAPGSEAALAELCRLYWYPLYAFVRYRGYAPDDAQDLTQGFFLHLLEHKALSHVDPLKGKFRSFLAASVQNFLSDEADRAGRKKRGGDREFVRIDAESAEERYRLEPVDYLTAETIFDARWAMTVLEEAMKRLRREYAAEEDTFTLKAVEPFLDPINNNRDLPSYEEVANELQVSLSAVKTIIHRLRKQYTGLLREEVGRTVSDPREIDDEIHALCGALVASEGRLDP
jgi:RNA polymerase sigma factor (sigma-70 family)